MGLHRLELSLEAAVRTLFPGHSIHPATDDWVTIGGTTFWQNITGFNWENWR